MLQTRFEKNKCSCKKEKWAGQQGKKKKNVKRKTKRKNIQYTRKT